FSAFGGTEVGTPCQGDETRGGRRRAPSFIPSSNENFVMNIKHFAASFVLLSIAAGCAAEADDASTADESLVAGGSGDGQDLPPAPNPNPDDDAPRPGCVPALDGFGLGNPAPQYCEA